MRNGGHRIDKSTKYITFLLILTLVPVFWTSVCCAVERVAVSGNVTYNGEPVTAMVLANGQYMFTGGGEGRFNLENVPLDANDEITLYAFCSGLSPYKTILDQGVSGFEIQLTKDTEASQPVVTINTFLESESRAGWFVISGTITNQNGIALCAMVLANGQYMFTCGSATGEFSLTVPPDGNGLVTIYGFCSGLMPFKQVIDPSVNIDDGDGYSADQGDCDNTDATVYPGAVELCDGKDNDCDGEVDEDCTSMYPLSIAAAGDSITVAYNADGIPDILNGQTYEQYEVSWALGDSDRVNSHAQRLWELEYGFSWNAELDNYAFAGANIADLKGQMTSMVENGPYDYVVILIGHNDICDASTASEMLTTAAFRDRFVAAMEILYTQDPPPAVVVSSLANVSNLYNAGKDDEWCNGNAFLGRSIWEWGNICRVVTSGDPDDIAAADLRTREFNAVLEEQSFVYGYKYVPDIYETGFTLDDLSDFDCFHPNVQGQNKISEIIWNKGLYSQ